MMDCRIGVIELKNGWGMEERMGRIVQRAAEAGLFVLLMAVVTGIWTCLWLPPF
jgi:hypothetical protein